MLSIHRETIGKPYLMNNSLFFIRCEPSNLESKDSKLERYL